MTTNAAARPAGLTSDDLLAAFTTAHGGVSEGRFASLDLSFAVGDEPDRVAENRRRVAALLDYDADRIVFARLVHGARVTCVEEADAGRGAWGADSNVPDTDALVTDVPGLPLGVLVADCAPVLLHDPVRGVIATSHAGWKGARDGVVAATVRTMRERYGTDAADVRVAVGPCIGVASLEMDPPDAEQCARAFPDHDVVQQRPGEKPRVDLRAMVLAQLVEAGVPAEAVGVAPQDTFTSPEFFSHRRAMREHGRTGGRFAGVIMLR